jgi:putative transposase
MNPSPVSYKRHRFPPQIFAHAVSLYFGLPLSLRLIEELLLESGMVGSLRDSSRLGSKLWTGLCKVLEAKEAETTRHLAFRRSGGHDQW